MLKDTVFKYYYDQKKSCSESLILGAGEYYGLNITEEESFLFTGFRGGMACGEACGALMGSMGALSRMYKGEEEMHWICSEYVSFFREKLGCNSINCSVLEPHYKTPERRCGATVELASNALEEFVEFVNASGKVHK